MMQDAAVLPITFQNDVLLESDNSPVISEREHEIRYLSSAFLPISAEATLEEGTLFVQYTYSTDDNPRRRPGAQRTFAFEEGEDYSLLLGAVTQRINKVGIKANSAKEFKRRVRVLTTKLKSWRDKNAQSRNYEIIASSLDSLSVVVGKYLSDNSTPVK